MNFWYFSWSGRHFVFKKRKTIRNLSSCEKDSRQKILHWNSEFGGCSAICAKYLSPALSSYLALSPLSSADLVFCSETMDEPRKSLARPWAIRKRLADVIKTPSAKLLSEDYSFDIAHVSRSHLWIYLYIFLALFVGRKISFFLEVRQSSAFCVFSNAFHVIFSWL